MFSKVKAGALTYAIFIMLITTVVIGSLVTIAFYHKNYISQELAQQKLISYTYSLITAAVNDSTLTFPWDGTNLELTDNGNYNFQVDRSSWGGYIIYTAKASYLNYSYDKTIMCGAKGVLDNNIALYLTDNNNAISISGNTELLGDCYLPKAGIKAAYMEGNFYKGKELVYGEIKKSEAQLPKVNEEYTTYINKIIAGQLEKNDSIIDFSKISSTDHYNSFNNTTVYYISSNPLYLNNCSFKGNIVIICSHEVTIFPSAELNNIIVAAPKITIKKGTQASLQAYASDTILLQQGVHLTFPSTLGLIGETNKELLSLERNAQVDGTIWMVKNTSEKENKNKCIFKPKSYLHGIAHIEGSVSMEGGINGSLYAEKFILKTAASYYENYIYNVQINAYAKLPFYSSAILNTKRSHRIIKVLEP